MTYITCPFCRNGPCSCYKSPSVVGDWYRGFPSQEKIKYGWICPLCGIVNAPHIDKCNCKDDKK